MYKIIRFERRGFQGSTMWNTQTVE
uniref:Uncharacterized protein n=1 Tax=Musa acuminata subsp. malaccensis TaxID=214687 RepID=A0A804I9X3_MUSAM